MYGRMEEGRDMKTSIIFACRGREGVFPDNLKLHTHRDRHHTKFVYSIRVVYLWCKYTMCSVCVVYVRSDTYGEYGL